MVSMVTAWEDWISAAATRAALCRATRNCNIPVLVMVLMFNMTSHAGGAVRRTSLISAAEPGS
jgi:hypothetical protein